MNFLSGSLTLLHLLLSGLLVISLLLSIFLVKKTEKNSLLLLNSMTLLIVPIYIDPLVDKPWISYGLLTAITVFTATTFQNRSLFLTILLITPFIQYFVATLNLNGVSDSKDLLLLNSYFSSIWLIVAGLGVYLARITYENYCTQMDDRLFALQDQLVEESRRKSELNLRDHQNISLHGTILNTLISYSHLKQSDISAKLAQDLEKDLINIESSIMAKNSSVPFIELLRENLKYEELEIELDLDPKFILPSEIIESALEIIREITLNIKKHTNSKLVRIKASNQSNFFEIRVEEYLPASLSDHELDQRLIGANSSKTLIRLTNKTGVEVILSNNTNQDLMIYSIKLYTSNQPINILNSIAELRRASLSRNVELLTAVSLVYSYIAIVGFVFIQIPLYISVAIAISTIALSIELFKKIKSGWLPIFSQLLLLTVLPYAILFHNECRDLLYTPWVFNAVLGAVLYGVAVIKNPFLKWMPALIFIGENYLTKLTFPKECQNLLDGSTPGFLFILAFGVLMARLRNRNIALDQSLEKSLNNQVENSKEVSEIVDFERSKIIEDLKLFTRNLTSLRLSDEHLSKKISFLIQKIRVFLICSEYFSYPLVQDIYKFSLDRIESESPTKVSIYTSDLDRAYNLDLELLKNIGQENKDRLLELVISNQNRLTIECFVDGDSVALLNITG